MGVQKIILIFFLLNASQAYSQWNEVTQFSHHLLMDIECLSEEEVFVVGTDSIAGVPTGVLHHSIDGGINWDTHHFENTDRMFKVFVVDADVIYVANHGSRIYKTIDGGTTWTLLNIPSGDPAVGIVSGYFINADIGLIGNAFGEIFKTVDGGLNWERVFFIQPFFMILDISCVSDSLCYASTVLNPNLLKSTDGGDTWDFINSDPFQFAPQAIAVLGIDSILAVGSDASIHRALDLESDWDTIPSPVNSIFNLKDVFFKDSIGYAVGTRDAIFKSADYGASWTVAQFDSTSFDWINAIYMVNETSAYACSLKGSVLRQGLFTSVETLSDKSKNDLNIYPNPVGNQMTVEFENVKNGTLEVFNLHGQRYHFIEIRNQTKVILDLQEVNSNILFLRFIEKDTHYTITKKIINNQ